MQSISKTRVIIVLLVTLFTTCATIPTVRYYNHLGKAPATTSQRPIAKTPPPPKDQKELYAQWEKDNPELMEWEKKNTAYLDWEKRNDELRQGFWGFPAIPLGLDLIGGVDVTLVIDEEKAIITEVSNSMNSLRDEFDRNKLSAKPDPDSIQGRTFTIKLSNAGDARQVYNVLKNYEGVLESIPSEEELKSLKPIRLTLKQTDLASRMQKSLEGARKGVRDRVDQLGVTQPNISIQGEKAIRVQVPGYGDPDRLINLVIKPAELEFRLVDPRNNEVLELDGKLKPGATIPLGTEVVPALDGKPDPVTHQIKYRPYRILLKNKAEMTGKYLRSAGVHYNPTDIANPIEVTLEFKDEGRRLFADITEKNVGRELAIMLDGTVRSHPNLKEPIREGRAQITGGFSNEEATELSQILKAGSLPAPLKIESKRTVGASIGADAIKSGVTALLYGAILIAAFMIIYYGTAGAIAVVALILNVIIVLAIMALSRATLTLSGIGGLLLTIGMAVDANVLIYERIREELREGRPLKQAIFLGVHRAFPVILDSHLSILISALVLLQFTEGSVLGFALTMTFGLISNLFTGLTVTYTLCGLWFAWRKTLSLGRIKIFHNVNFDFIGARWFSWSASTAIGVAAIIFVFSTGGLRYGVDFAGGVSSNVNFTQKVTDDQIRNALRTGGLQDPNVQNVVGTSIYVVEVKLAKTAPGKSSADVVQETETMVRDALDKAFPKTHTIEKQTSFGAQTAQQFGYLAILVTVLASGAILIYLWFRFELVFGVSAVVALLHDLVIVFFCSSIWGVQVNLEVVAALMVLMGFSVNDTIVIFDRIRENTRVMHGKSFGEICNLAMNQSLSRTILTSGTVFMAVMMLYLVGGEGLRSFAKVYLLGTVFGTYSSDFIAAPIVYQWNKYKGNRLQIALATKKKKKEAAKPIRSAGAATRPTQND